MKRFLTLFACLCMFGIYAEAQVCATGPASVITNADGNLPCDAACGTPFVTAFDIWANEGYPTGQLTNGSEYTVTLGTGAAACGAGFVGNVEILVGAWDGTTVTSVVGFDSDLCGSGGSFTFTVPADGDYIIIFYDTGDCVTAGNTDSGQMSVDCSGVGATCPAAALPDPAPAYLTCAGGTQGEHYTQYYSGATGGVISSLWDTDGDGTANVTETADDFVVPAGGWTLDGVFAPGSFAGFGGTGNITNVTVTVYADAGGMPGAAVCTETGAPVSALTDPNISFQFTTPCVLPAGNYWLSVVVAADDRWNWGDANSNNAGSLPYLQDPADEFGGLATTWTDFPTLGLGTDMSFTLNFCSGAAPVCANVTTISAAQAQCHGTDAAVTVSFDADASGVSVTVNGVNGVVAAGATSVVINVPTANQGCDFVTTNIVWSGTCPDGSPVLEAAGANIQASYDVYPDAFQAVVETPGGCGTAALALLVAADGTTCDSQAGNIPAQPACDSGTTNMEPLNYNFAQLFATTPCPQGPWTGTVAADCASVPCGGGACCSLDVDDVNIDVQCVTFTAGDDQFTVTVTYTGGGAGGPYIINPLLGSLDAGASNDPNVDPTGVLVFTYTENMPVTFTDADGNTISYDWGFVITNPPGCCEISIFGNVDPACEPTACPTFGPAEVLGCVTKTDGVADTYTVSIPFTGGGPAAPATIVDATGSLSVDYTNGNPATDASGTILITYAEGVPYAVIINAHLGTGCVGVFKGQSPVCGGCPLVIVDNQNCINGNTIQITYTFNHGTSTPPGPGGYTITTSSGNPIVGDNPMTTQSGQFTVNYPHNSTTPSITITSNETFNGAGLLETCYTCDITLTGVAVDCDPQCTSFFDDDCINCSAFTTGCNDTYTVIIPFGQQGSHVPNPNLILVEESCDPLGAMANPSAFEAWPTNVLGAVVCNPATGLNGYSVPPTITVDVTNGDPRFDTEGYMLVTISGYECDSNGNPFNYSFSILDSHLGGVCDFEFSDVAICEPCPFLAGPEVSTCNGFTSDVPAAQDTYTMCIPFSNGPIPGMEILTPDAGGNLVPIAPDFGSDDPTQDASGQICFTFPETASYDIVLSNANIDRVITSNDGTSTVTCASGNCTFRFDDEPPACDPAPCNFAFTGGTAECLSNETGAGNDTYNAIFTFVGGGNPNLVVTDLAGNPISYTGDNPAFVAAGTITVTATEGTNVTILVSDPTGLTECNVAFTVINNSCDLPCDLDPSVWVSCNSRTEGNSDSYTVEFMYTGGFDANGNGYHFSFVATSPTSTTTGPITGPHGNVALVSAGIYELTAASGSFWFTYPENEDYIITAVGSTNNSCYFQWQGDGPQCDPCELGINPQNFVCQSEDSYSIDLTQFIQSGGNMVNGGTFSLSEIPPFISEIEYNDDTEGTCNGTTVAGTTYYDFVEISGSTDTDLDCYALYFYQRTVHDSANIHIGSDSGMIYNPGCGAFTTADGMGYVLSGLVLDAEAQGLNGEWYGADVFTCDAMNLLEGPAGIALVRICDEFGNAIAEPGNDEVVQFIGYGLWDGADCAPDSEPLGDNGTCYTEQANGTNYGIFSSCEGPASGIVSVDVNVVDNGGVQENASIQFTNTCWVNPSLDDPELNYGPYSVNNSCGYYSSPGALNYGLLGDNDLVDNTDSSIGNFGYPGGADELYWDYIAPNGDIFAMDRLCWSLFVASQTVSMEETDPVTGGVDNDLVEFNCATPTYTASFEYTRPEDLDCIDGNHTFFFDVTVLMDIEDDWTLVDSSYVCENGGPYNLTEMIDDGVHWIQPSEFPGNYSVTETFERSCSLLPEPFISEFHYDDYENDQTATASSSPEHCVIYQYYDANGSVAIYEDNTIQTMQFCEGVEISGLVGTDLSCYDLVFYNTAVISLEEGVVRNDSLDFGLMYNVTYIGPNGVPVQTDIDRFKGWCFNGGSAADENGLMHLYGQIDNDHYDYGWGQYDVYTIMSVPFELDANMGTVGNGFPLFPQNLHQNEFDNLPAYEVQPPCGNPVADPANGDVNPFFIQTCAALIAAGQLDPNGKGPAYFNMPAGLYADLNNNGYFDSGDQPLGYDADGNPATADFVATGDVEGPDNCAWIDDNFAWERRNNGCTLTDTGERTVGSRWFPIHGLYDQLGAIGLYNSCTREPLDLISYEPHGHSDYISNFGQDLTPPTTTVGYAGGFRIANIQDYDIAGPFENRVTYNTGVSLAGQTGLGSGDIQTGQLLSLDYANTRPDCSGTEGPLFTNMIEGTYNDLGHGPVKTLGVDVDFAYPRAAHDGTNGYAWYVFDENVNQDCDDDIIYDNSIGYYNCGLDRSVPEPKVECFHIDLSDLGSEVPDNAIITAHNFSIDLDPLAGDITSEGAVNGGNNTYTDLCNPNITHLYQWISGIDASTTASCTATTYDEVLEYPNTTAAGSLAGTQYSASHGNALLPTGFDCVLDSWTPTCPYACCIPGESWSDESYDNANDTYATCPDRYVGECGNQVKEVYKFCIAATGNFEVTLSVDVSFTQCAPTGNFSGLGVSYLTDGYWQFDPSADGSGVDAAGNTIPGSGIPGVGLSDFSPVFITYETANSSDIQDDNAADDLSCIDDDNDNVRTQPINVVSAYVADLSDYDNDDDYIEVCLDELQDGINGGGIDLTQFLGPQTSAGYFWANNDLTAAALQGYILTPSEGGVYTFTHTVAGSGACPASDDFTINVIDEEDPDFSFVEVPGVTTEVAGVITICNTAGAVNLNDIVNITAGGLSSSASFEYTTPIYSLTDSTIVSVDEGTFEVSENGCGSPVENIVVTYDYSNTDGGFGDADQITLIAPSGEVIFDVTNDNQSGSIVVPVGDIANPYGEWSYFVESNSFPWQASFSVTIGFEAGTFSGIGVSLVDGVYTFDPTGLDIFGGIDISLTTGCGVCQASPAVHTIYVIDCDGGGCAAPSVNFNPETNVTCNEQGNAATVTFSISGDGPFTVNGAEISGNVYSTSVATGASQNFAVSSAGCSAVTNVSVDVDCGSLAAINDPQGTFPVGSTVDVSGADILNNDIGEGIFIIDMCTVSEQGVAIDFDENFNFTYTNPGFVGEDRICYTIEDAEGNTDMAYITIEFSEFGADVASECQEEAEVGQTGVYDLVIQVIGGSGSYAYWLNVPEEDLASVDPIEMTSCNQSNASSCTEVISGLISDSAESSYLVYVTDLATGDIVGPFTSDFVTCVKTAINLTDFDGDVLEAGNNLFWSTATEENTSHFELQRSVDGVNFTTLTNVDAAGFSTSNTAYEFLDKTAPNGLSYYRLVSVDNDGTSEVHEQIVTLTRGDAAAFGIVEVYPIPTSDDINIAFTSATNNEVSLAIFDVAGKLVKEVAANASSTTLNSVTIDVRGLASGMYFITLNDGVSVAETKFIKEN